jgi:predicted dehydrogenase
VGFNHRFHPAFIDIKRELALNSKDPIMYLRASYGNGGRVGFDREWRADPHLAGGGELVDQGVHVLDLAAQLLKELSVKAGLTRTHYWDMQVDDNAWALLTTPKGQTFSMHVSSTEWKNEFRFEVYTRTRKYQWTGLGKSYGPETLTIYKMKPEMGPPDVEHRQYSPDDNSWRLENKNFVEACQGGARIDGGFDDALSALKLVDDIYSESKR